MQDTLRTQLQSFTSNEEKFNFLREYCQLLILKVSDDIGCFQHLAFVGGTALRILYDLKRYSEDLGYCLVNSKGYSFSNLMDKLQHELRLYNLDVDVRYKDHKTVASAFIKFTNLMSLAGLSPHKDQKLLIKFEVDQNPPAGYNTQLSVISKEFLTAINHFDLPSLYAGKLHALFCRKYSKGRDYYDLLWYMGRKITPNFVFLNNAIAQTESNKFVINEDNFYSTLREKIRMTDFEKIKYDVTPFLVDPKEARYFEKEFFISIIEANTQR